MLKFIDIILLFLKTSIFPNKAYSNLDSIQNQKYSFFDFCEMMGRIPNDESNVKRIA